MRQLVPERQCAFVLCGVFSLVAGRYNNLVVHGVAGSVWLVNVLQLDGVASVTDPY